MTRLHPGVPAARTLRALIGIAAGLVLAVVASGCTSSPSPVPTPDPFVGLADRSDQAFRQGLESYGQGQYRDALTSFEQARLLSPTVDPRIDQMIARSQVELAPRATPVPATPTVVPVVPSPTPVAMSTQTPDAELGSRYFGRVTLAMVPGRDTEAPPASQFFFQDQIGLHIDGLKQHLRLPFTVRVFNADTSGLIAEVQSDEVATAQPTVVAQPMRLALTPNSTVVDAATSATPGSTDIHLARFWDTFVWYHRGGDEPGRYRVELFANGVLTNTFDYSVGTVPVPTPPVVLEAEPTSAPAEPTAVPSPVELPAPAAAPVASRPSSSLSTAPAEAAEPTLVPTPLPSATPVPTPQTAYTTIVGGIPAGLDVAWNTGRFFLADASGVIWSSDAPTGWQQPTLGTPFNIGARSPVDLAVDQSNGYLYLSTRVCSPDMAGLPPPPGCVVVVDGGGTVIKSIALTGPPADLRIDSDLGLVYVSIPTRQELVEIDARRGAVIATIGSVPQITSLALDPVRHMLYAAALTGELTVVDGVTGKMTERMLVTGAGLASVATARGLAYAVNTATHELAVVEPVSQSVIRYALSQEPAAVAAAEDTGAVYVLDSRADTILRIDPSDGSELGRVVIGNRTGHAAIQPNDIHGLRPRLVLNSANDTVYATVPEAGSLAAVNDGSFPILAREIPQPSIPDQAVAGAIPDALWPASVWGDSAVAQGH